MPIVRPTLSAMLLATLAGGLAPASAAPPASNMFQIVNQFGIAANPTGVWSYLADGKDLKVGQTPCFNGSVTGFNCWWTTQPIPNSIYVGKNTTKHAISTQTIVAPPNYLWLDPEAGSITVRFTAPAAATYAIVGDFLGIDTNEQSHPVQVLHGKKALFSGTVASYTQRVPFKLSVALLAGEHIDFTAQTGASYSNLSTGLRATITAP